MQVSATYWVFSSEVIVEASLVGAAGGVVLAVSVLAEPAVEPLVDGVIGADATEGSGVELGVEVVGLAAGSVLNGARLSELAGVELWVAACVLAAGVGREAGALGRLAPMCAVVLDDVFATLAGSTGALVTVGLVSVVVVEETSAGAGVAGTALPESARLAVFAAGWGTAISLFLTL